ncbi:carboxypeptidase-like regulatory domain-containing protein [Terracidiphilus gabretensis]|uniref:carboxypeptidase-like regulatory domain-containing protein n=1 Tax=Terracidiphilus gabretensis TaxID=1577687 RepID=UPI00071B461B|nr:carboxypeptidase-like regulatory domain-containing protein [Terracidiphilus gabretensis]
MSNTFKKCIFALWIAMGLALYIPFAEAQSSTSGSISGTVTDASGAAVQNATVTLTNTDRGSIAATRKTNSAGFYTAESLPLGTYSVTIASGGFKTETITGLALHAADALTVNRNLVPGAVNEVITVTAEQARVNLEDATSAGLINSTQINEMPLLTRNYEVLMTLQPGVAFGGATDDLTRGPSGLSGASSTVAFSVNGGRTTSNNWTIDGADNLDRGANLTLYTYPSPDAIAEFKTLRGQYSAQFGRNASGQVDVVTKSGTNSIHGSAYEYFRNNDLDANGYANNFLGTKIGPYHYNVFGFSAGGPVYIPKLYNGRNKTFFFVSEEWQRIIQTLSSAEATVPQASERNGDFSQSGQKIGSNWTTAPVNVCTAYTTSTANQVNTCTAAGYQVTNLSPLAQAYMKDVYANIPVPDVAYNLAHNLDPHTILTNFKDTFNNLDSVVRIDQQFGQRVSVFYRYMHDTFPELLPQGQFTTVYIAGANTTSVVNPGTQHLAHGTVTISPTLVLNAGYAFSNGNIVSTPSGFLASANSPDIKPTLPYANTVGLVPTLSVNGMTTLNGSVAYTDHGTNHQIFGDLTKTLHTHTLIGGFSYSHYQKLENNTTGTQGSFGFNTDVGYACPAAPAAPTPGCVIYNGYSGEGEAQAFANFLTGNANSGFSQLSKDPVTDQKEALWEGFAQDNWKATPRLTFNLGVRYSYYGQPWDANGLLSNFDPAKYDPTKAPTINANGLICFTGACNQTNSNAGQPTTPNPNADYAGINYINGMIFNGPSSANNNQASPWGNKVGRAQKLNFAPRFGFALDVFGDGKTALRGGYGWAFDDAEVSYYETTVFDNPPAVATYSVSEGSLDSPAGGALTALSATPGRLQAVPTDYKTPYVQQFSLDVQQQLSPTFFLDLGYFGDHGTHLLGALQANQPLPGSWMGVVNPTSASSGCTLGGQPAFISSTCDRVLNQIKPYIGYFAIDSLKTIFSSNYNSLQAKATKRFYGKTYIDANFTWSRDLTNAQADYSGFVQNIYNINGDYGRAAVDRKFTFTLDGVLEEPWFRQQHGLTGRLLGGWEISGIYSANSGLPLTVSASGGSTVQYNLPTGVTSVYNKQINGGVETDNAGLSVLGNTNAGLRPNQIGDPNSGHNIKIHNKSYESGASPWFYTGAFAAPAQNSPIPGTARRGTIAGPGYGKLDLGIFRNFRIWDRVNFQFRAEALNVTNHTNVQTIGTSSSSSLFGTVEGYRDARIMQFAGKFTF